MKSLFLRLTMAGSLMLSSSVLFADTVNTGASNVWTNLTAGSNAGGNFFSNASNDGSQCNIGYLLTGATVPTSCANRTGDLSGLPTGKGVYSYLNNGSGGPAGNFNFTSNPIVPAGATHATTLHLELAGSRDGTSFGYRMGGSDFELFGPVTANPVSVTFTIPASTTFSFWFKAGTQTFYTDNSASSNRFALFRFGQTRDSSQPLANGTNLNAYVLAMEDGPARTDGTFGDKDFQDMVVSIQVVPEPGTMSALAAAVLATVAAVRRRRKA